MEGRYVSSNDIRLPNDTAVQRRGEAPPSAATAGWAAAAKKVAA
jgi:hypothetical protein